MDNKHSTERILNVILEIIYLLTGEDYDVLKTGSGERLSIICPHEPFPTPFCYLTTNPYISNMILDVAEKITELLTGEVPIRCQDVSVYFSMEEWEYLEGHKDLYKDIVMMEHQPYFSHVHSEEKKFPLLDMILNLLLDVIYQLTGEECLIVKKISPVHYTERSLSPGLCKSQDSIIALQSYSEYKGQHKQKILKVTQKMIGLLTGEVPIRCQDVSVYFSMEEWENLEGHKDLYKDIVMMEDQPPLTSPDYKVEENEDFLRVTSTDADINQYNADRSPDHEESYDNSYQGITVSNDPFPCRECEKCFSEESHLVAHQRTHSTEGPFMYSEGNDVATSTDTPQVIHHTRSWPYSCSECGKSLKRKCELRIHERTHTGEEIFSCTECEKSFTAKSQLQKHQKYHTREKPFSCPQCKKSFMEKSQIVAHQRSHSREKPFSCAECRKTFATKSHLVRHQKYHVNEKPFPCSECEMSFTTISGLVKHQRVHTGEKPFSCSQCGRSFSQKENFITHVKRHAGEMPFTCSECGKCFSSNGHLLTHQRTHTGERPFSCSECGRSFTQKVNLLRHEMRHKGQRPYSCSECGKCFIDKAYLILHQRNHTGERPFACSECEKCFTRRGHLLKHQRSHTNVRPFSCSLCGKSYTEKGHFITHQRTHTGERPFSCPECGKCFASKGSLLAHQKRHMLKHLLNEQSEESVLDE